MAYIVFCRDAPQATQLREQHLQAHLAYIAGIVDQVQVAGPMGQPRGESYDGSCFVYATDDIDVAQELFFNDPYYQAGIYQRFSFHRFYPAAGAWVGGVTW